MSVAPQLAESVQRVRRARQLRGDLPEAESAGFDIVPASGYEGDITTVALVFLLARAFSSASVALTGVEAISTGVPAFQKPKSRNAATTRVSLDRPRTSADSDGESHADNLPDPDPLPDEVAQRLEAQHTVRLAVAALDERCCALLTMLFLQPEPPAYSEIAASTGVPEGSIGPTRARCLQKLKRQLDAVGW